MHTLRRQLQLLPRHLPRPSPNILARRRLHSRFVKAATAVALLACSLRSGAEVAESPTADEDEPKKAPTVTLQLAPGALGELRSEGRLLLATEAGGQEIYVLNTQDEAIWTFLEDGDSWGDHVGLQSDGVSSLPMFGSFAVANRSFAFVGPKGLYLFNRKGYLQQKKETFEARDIVSDFGSHWAVSLLNLPHPKIPGRFFFRTTKKGDLPAQLLMVDRQLETAEEGLPSSDQKHSGGAAAGRSLRLAWGDGKLYAAELANYQIYELDSSLEEVNSFRDPELFLEEGRESGEQVEGQPDAEGENEADEESAPPDLNLGKNALKSSDASKRRKGSFVKFNLVPVILDIAWDDSAGLLVILLDSGAVGEHAAIDWLDPNTGEVTRISIALPKAAKGSAKLTQLVVSEHYLWLRGYPGTSPTFRLEKNVRELGMKLLIPESSLESQELEK